MTELVSPDFFLKQYCLNSATELNLPRLMTSIKSWLRHKTKQLPNHRLDRNPRFTVPVLKIPATSCGYLRLIRKMFVLYSLAHPAASSGAWLAFQLNRPPAFDERYALIADKPLMGMCTPISSNPFHALQHLL